MADQSSPTPHPCACGAPEIPSTNIENGGKDQPDRFYIVCLTCHHSNRVDPAHQCPPGFPSRPEAIADWNSSVQSRS
ncbi:hypothetical protein BH09VER1_BH09VER1_32870 [soil metagenome]